MSYLVLARKYRPADFDSVTGQEHVVRTLKNSIKSDRIHHAYLFCGPRGVGKTSIARILAKALNFEDGPSAGPFEGSKNAEQIDAGTSLAVREIDGASHNSVENVRELIDSFRALPAPGWRYKIYIIDEVHMLSNSAFNALLKSLEEPPPNTVFILATTEVHKIPDTVLSRCQRHDFRALSPDTIFERLQQIVDKESITTEAEALRVLARLADGSMRDAQSLLDRAIAYCENSLTVEETCEALGLVTQNALLSICSAILKNDPDEALELLDASLRSGTDTGLFLREFVSFWRELLLAKFGGDKALERVGLFDQAAQERIELMKEIDPADVQDLVQLARSGADAAYRSSYPRYALESLLVRMATREPCVSIAQIVRSTAQSRAKSGSGSGGGGGSQGRPGQSKPQISSTPTAVSAMPKQSAQAERAVERKKVEVATSEQHVESQQSESVVEPSISSTAKSSTAESSTADWDEFIAWMSKNAPVLLVEQLKRFVPVNFGSEALEAEAPRFVLGYIGENGNRAKLEKFICQYFKCDSYVLNLREGLAGQGKSLAERIEKERRDQRKQKAQDLASHPSVQALRKAYPGSTLDNLVLSSD